jgi:hypothetical protein
MMSIPDKNETIYQVIYTTITGGSSMKVLKEFGFFNYFIFPDENFECKNNISNYIIFSHL